MNKKVLFDANSFIAPYNMYYSPEIVPSYWRYLLEIAPQIVLLDKVYNEVIKGKDSLGSWLHDHKKEFCFLSSHSEDIFNACRQVMVYLDESPLYQENAVLQWSDIKVADPWLIAAARVNGYKIVTFEKGSKPFKNSPSKKPKIPVVGKEFGVECEDLFSYLNRMGMRL